jgi:tetratricopeptide (TPR) repeat protein
VSRSRQQTSQSDNPFTTTIQVTSQQGSAWPLFADYSNPAPRPDDAAAHYNRGSELRRLKRFAEALAAFDGAIALKPDYAEAHNSRGIVLASLTRLDDALASFDQAIVLKPDYAEAYNNRGIVLQDANRLDDAILSFDKAIALFPDHAVAHNNRAVALQDVKRFDDALEGFDRAIALKLDYAEAYYNRAMALHALNRFDEALAGFGKAIALRPDYAEAYHNLGTVLQDLTRLDDALAAYGEAIALRPDYAEAYNNQSFCLLQKGSFEQGWRLHEWRKKLEAPVGNRFFPQPLWLGREDISDKTLFVHWEQGLGDTLQFCRYGKLLRDRGARVVMSVQEPLYRLLKRMSPYVRIINHDEVPAAFDYYCPMMSLPLALGTTLDTILSEQCYIFADEQACKAWDARLPPKAKPPIGIAKIRIGVAWSGNAKHKNDHNRSIDLATFAPLFSADAHWISLQKELRRGDAALLQELRIASYGDEMKDFADTAALIDVLDLVITVDTSVAHLAGAMGKQVWILLPYHSDWRWLLDRDDSPWYPTARLFRQDEMRSWENVIARVHAAVHDFVRAPRSSSQ